MDVNKEKETRKIEGNLLYDLLNSFEDKYPVVLTVLSFLFISTFFCIGRSTYLWSLSEEQEEYYSHYLEPIDTCTVDIKNTGYWKGNFVGYGVKRKDNRCIWTTISKNITNTIDINHTALVLTDVEILKVNQYDEDEWRKVEKNSPVDNHFYIATEFVFPGIILFVVLILLLMEFFSLNYSYLENKFNAYHFTKEQEDYYSWLKVIRTVIVILIIASIIGCIVSNVIIYNTTWISL